MAYLSGAYFEVMLIGTGALLEGKFTSVSGLDMEIEYEISTKADSTIRASSSNRTNRRCWCSNRAR